MTRHCCSRIAAAPAAPITPTTAATATAAPEAAAGGALLGPLGQLPQAVSSLLPPPVAPDRAAAMALPLGWASLLASSSSLSAVMGTAASGRAPFPDALAAPGRWHVEARGAGGVCRVVGRPGLLSASASATATWVPSASCGQGGGGGWAELVVDWGGGDAHDETSALLLSPTPAPQNAPPRPARLFGPFRNRHDGATGDAGAVVADLPPDVDPDSLLESVS
eukprot:gene53832-42686_t